MDKDKFKRYESFAYSTVYSEPETPEFHTPLIKMAVENFFDKLFLDKESLIYDIGCGQGAFLEQMESRGYHNIVGVTLSNDDADACKDKGFSVDQCDMSDLLLNDEQIDLIWCRHALEHSPYPLFTLLEFNRTLKTGGKLYVEVPAPELPRLHEFNSNHYSILGPKMWAALFSRTGFAVNTFNEMKFQVQEPNKDAVDEVFYCFLLEKKYAISYTEG